MHALRALALTLVAAILPALTRPASAQDVAVPLNNYQRLGQSFQVKGPLEAIRVTVPSWSDNEGGFTLTLWDGPERRRKLAAAVFTNVVDNAQVALRLPRPLPAGSYYWEISTRTGTTRVGLYAARQPSPNPAECIYLDGVPDPSRRFLFSALTSARISEDTARLLKQLETGSREERAEACRQLAAVGGEEAVPALARLLTDPALSHMARFALQPMPSPAAEKALLQALDTTAGRLRVGIVNSLAARRSQAAVPRLRQLIRSEDPETARAALAALGLIGSATCADILEGALRQPDARWGATLYDASLHCAAALLRAGSRQRANKMYAQLLRAAKPEHIREAAARGGLETAGPEAQAELIRYLRGQDDALARAALWMANRALPGEALTRRLVEEVARVPAERRIALLRAIASRRDAAVPAALTQLIGGSDPELSQAAREALRNLPVETREQVIEALLKSNDSALHLTGIVLVRDLRLPRFTPALRPLLRATESDVRVSAMQAMGDLSDAPDLPPLLEALGAARSDAETEAAEQAITSLCGRSADSEGCAVQIAGALRNMPPARQAGMVRLLGSLGGPAALQSIRAALNASEEAVRVAALEALWEWKTPDAAPDLRRLAQSAKSAGEQVRALRGLLRIASNRDVSPEQRLALCREARPLIQRDEEKVLLLAALSAIPAVDSVTMAADYLEGTTTREEAAAAVVAAAEPLIQANQGAAVRQALEKAASLAQNPETRQRAQALLARVKG